MHNRAVIRATELSGRAVVDLDGAEKVGTIERVVLDPDARRVAAFLVSRGATPGGTTMHMTVPASSVHAIGPDALTIHRSQMPAEDSTHRSDDLPKASDLIGCKVVSEDGRFLGKIDDVLISREDGSILGYTLGGHSALDRLEGLFRRGKEHHEPYIRGDAELRAGEDMIIVPAAAVSEEWEVDDDGSGPEVACAWSHAQSERRGIEPGTPLAPGTTIRRSD